MSNDALERLKKRQRPNVPSRDASLSAPSQDISTSRYQESEISRDQDTEISGKPPEQLLTKQSTLRLETSLSQRLSEVCQDNELSREVLIEALFEYYSNDPEAWQAILAEAKRRGERRMQMANLKRAKSMMQRFS
jgi:hypothetical protein